MMKTQLVAGMALANPAGLPVLPKRPEDVMASVPGWAELIDPAHVDTVVGSHLNRAGDGESHMWPATSFRNPGFTTYLGQPAMLLTSTTDPEGLRVVRVNTPAGKALGPAWSVFGVMDPRKGGDGSPMDLYRGGDSGTSGALGLRIGLSPAGLPSIYPYANSYSAPRLAAPTENNLYSMAAGWKLLMFTSSPQNGLAIFVNGVRVAAAPADVAPIAASNGPEEAVRAWFRNARGYYGMSGRLDIDLNTPANAGHMTTIESFLKTKYGIT